MREVVMRFNITDNVLMRALGKICDLMLLNILWVICSIPVFTIGASTTALYAVVLKMVRNEEGYIVKGFLKAFKENFRQSTVAWLILLVLGIVCWIDGRIAVHLSGTVGMVMTVLIVVFGFLLFGVAIYVFPLIARYENSLKNTFQNAVLLALGKLPYTLLMMAVFAGISVASLWTGYTLLFSLPLWGVIGVSALACMNSYILKRVFLVFGEEADNTKEEDAE